MKTKAQSKLSVVHSDSSTRRQLFTGAIGAATATRTASADAAKTTKASTLTISLNGEDRPVALPEETELLYVLRDEFGLRGPKFGCGLSQCGACAVLSDGEQIRSCITSVGAVGKSKIVTLEGLAADYYGKEYTAGKLHPLQTAWINHQVPQCGYCQSGMIIQAASLLRENPNPTEEQIKINMNGHLCRCGSHFRILKAVQEGAKMMRAEHPNRKGIKAKGTKKKKK